MSLEALLNEMAAAACQGRGDVFAALFAEDGAYHDVFYGTFRGRSELAAFVEERVHRDGGSFRWTFRDVVEAGGRGYGRYVFSYAPKTPSAATRVAFEGVAFAVMREGRLLDYDELANPYPALSMMGRSAESIARFAARQSVDLRERTELAEHFA